MGDWEPEMSRWTSRGHFTRETDISEKSLQLDKPNRPKCPDGHTVDIPSAKWTTPNGTYNYCRNRCDLSTARTSQRAFDSRNVHELQRHRCAKMSTSP